MLGREIGSTQALRWGSASDANGVLRGRRERQDADAATIESGTDGELVQFACQGSVAAREELIRRYQDRVYTVAYGYLRDREEALDATQDIFVKMLEGLPRFREQSSFYTWLYRIAVNRCIDRRRTRERTPATSSLQEMEGEGVVEPREYRSAMCPHASLETRELREQIHAAIAAVPELYRIPVILSDIQGLSTTEMAAILGCPLNTVKTRLHRGRTAIRERLRAYLRGEEDELPRGV